MSPPVHRFRPLIDSDESGGDDDDKRYPSGNTSALMQQLYAIS
jgi:hypothetical protein